MREKSLIVILSLILLVIGIVAFKVDMNLSEFNFYKSDLIINNSSITETLSFQPNQDYHTLYRNFQSSIYDSQIVQKNTIEIEEIRCSSGTAYYNTPLNCYVNNSLSSTECLEYTEKNEYGCSFGNVYGFFNGNEYQISAKFMLNPENIFNINGKNYVKFVAYGRDMHKTLIVGKNLMIIGDSVSSKKYYPDEYVILYLPYNESTEGMNIITQKNFEFDNRIIKHLIQFILATSPAFLLFFVWYAFGKERKDESVPKELSMYPVKREAWKVAAIFNPPFSSNNPRMLTTILTDFYNRKIIDINIKEKKIWIKLLSEKPIQDKTEKEFFKFLKSIEGYSKKENEYFKLDSKEISQGHRLKLGIELDDINKNIKKESKNYFEKRGIGVVASLFLSVAIISFLLKSITSGVFLLLSFALVFIVSLNSSLLIRFKEDYYSEYLKWQSFKRFLGNSESMKLHGHKGTIIWGEMLVYATALGKAKKILKELKERGLITEKQYNNYVIITSPYYLSTNTGGFGSSGGGMSGGGFSGAGAGGVGGGGGGGR